MSMASIPKGQSTAWNQFSTVFLRLLLPGYILAGAVLKLLHATPGKMPGFMQSWFLNSTMEPGTIESIISTIIGVEFIAALSMILLPRFAKIAGGLILTAFIFVLVAEVSYLTRQHTLLKAMFDGSCGCFGEAVTIPPGVMLMIDGLLLGLVVASKPSRAAIERIGTAPVIAFIALAITSGALAFQAPLIKRESTVTQAELGDHMLRPRLWIDKPFAETPLVRIVDLDPTMLGGGTQHWIFYRKSCSICHALFEEKYADADLPEGVDVVVAIHVPPTPGAPALSEEEVICPTCEFVELDPNADWVITTPGTVIIKDGVIIDYIDGQMAEYHIHGGDIE